MLQKKELIEYCHKVSAKGFVAAADGNLSLRRADGTIVITSSGIPKGDTNFENIVQCNLDGQVKFSKLKISTESKLHFNIYNKRSDVNAVIHCHPPVATAYASSGKSLDVPVFPEIVLNLGRIPLCTYATPSTDALPESMNEYIEYANVFLLQNHGAVAVGRNIREAYFRMEKLEHYAKTMFYAEGLGGAKKLTREQIDELYRLAPTVYNISLDIRNKF